MAVYGYARVSSSDQNETRQLESLKQAGCEKIYLDKQSGKDFERPEYKKMVRKLKAGDVLFVHSLDRFGRNYQLIREQWEHIVKKKNAHIVVLDMPILDTRMGQNLIGAFISDIVLQLLAFVAQQEREHIHKRQAEGIAAAKKRGVKFGREELPLPDNFYEISLLWAQHKISVSKAAKLTGMARSTFRRKAGKATEETRI